MSRNWVDSWRVVVVVVAIVVVLAVVVVVREEQFQQTEGRIVELCVCDIEHICSFHSPQTFRLQCCSNFCHENEART